MLIATPLGTALALGLQRWRGPRLGRGERADAAAAGHARARLRGRHVPAVHDGVRVHRAGHDGAGDRAGDVHALVGRADRARAAGDDRARRRGGGGRPRRAAAAASSRRVLLPLLVPAIAASLLVAFALSIDDFVVAQYLASGADTTTVPMRIYAQARGGADAGAQRAGDDHARRLAAGARARLRSSFRRFTRGEEQGVGARAARDGRGRRDERGRHPARSSWSSASATWSRSTASTCTCRGGEFFTHARPVGLRQDDDAAADRRLRAARRGRDPARRRRHVAHAAAQAAASTRSSRATRCSRT